MNHGGFGCEQKQREDEKRSDSGLTRFCGECIIDLAVCAHGCGVLCGVEMCGKFVVGEPRECRLFGWCIYDECADAFRSIADEPDVALGWRGCARIGELTQRFV